MNRLSFTMKWFQVLSSMRRVKTRTEYLTMTVHLCIFFFALVFRNIIYVYLISAKSLYRLKKNKKTKKNKNKNKQTNKKREFSLDL